MRKYSPDFIVRLNNGAHLILATKGQDNDYDATEDNPLLVTTTARRRKTPAWTFLFLAMTLIIQQRMILSLTSGDSQLVAPFGRSMNT